MARKDKEVIYNSEEHYTKDGERIVYRDREPVKKKRNPFLWGCLSLLGLLFLLGACSVIFGINPDETEETSTEETTEDATTEKETTEDATTEEMTTEKVTTQEQTTEEIVTEETATEAKTSSGDVSREFKAALASAENYNDFMPMSKAGLYNQLTSEAGDQYPPEAAQYAIANLKADYKENALKSAENYNKTMPMSDQELYNQLTSDAGDQYTPEEAQYAIDNMKK